MNKNTYVVRDIPDALDTILKWRSTGREAARIIVGLVDDYYTGSEFVPNKNLIARLEGRLPPDYYGGDRDE